MKTLTCKQLGGPCNASLSGDSFEAIGAKSHAHVMEQMQNGDEAHLAAADKMKNATPEERQRMMAEFRKHFDEAPEM